MVDGRQQSQFISKFYIKRVINRISKTAHMITCSRPTYNAIPFNMNYISLSVIIVVRACVCFFLSVLFFFLFALPKLKSQINFVFFRLVALVHAINFATSFFPLVQSIFALIMISVEISNCIAKYVFQRMN